MLIRYSQDYQNIFVIGDLNSRTASHHDFILNDNLHNSVLDVVGGLFTYVVDDTLPNRVNPDKGTNDFGSRLLNLCKSCGLRIVNGRHIDGLANDFTFCGSRGLSV